MKMGEGGPEADPGAGAQADLLGELQFRVVAVLAGVFDEVPIVRHLQDEVGGGAGADCSSVLFERHGHLPG